MEQLTLLDRYENGAPLSIREHLRLRQYFKLLGKFNVMKVQSRRKKNKITIKIMREGLIDAVIDLTNVSYSCAKEIVKKSTASEMLETDIDFIGHYPYDYWANEIIEEHIKFGRILHG